MGGVQGVITIESISGALDQSYEQIGSVISRLSDPLSEAPDEGGWTVRQLLSHLIGSLQRVPVHTGFILGGASSVPLLVGDEYWIPEWETAPLRSFSLGLEAAYAGVRAILSSITSADLDRECGTPFGDMPFAQFLLISVNGHIARFHGAQMEAFATTP